MTKAEFRRIRIHLGMSQTKLAEELGYKTYGAISRKERGIRPITKRDEIAMRALADKATK